MAEVFWCTSLNIDTLIIFIKQKRYSFSLWCTCKFGDKALEELRRALKFQEDLQGSALDDLASAAVARAQCASGK